MTAYIDLNIFDRLEKIDKLSESEKTNYQILLSLLTEKKLLTVYSNAHLNDLFRGYQKNPDFTEGHLKNIQSLTNNLCICQYWGEKTVRLHHRDIFEFFQEKSDELIIDPNT